MDIPRGQKARVLLYLMRYGSITPHDAMREFGIMRLAAVIFELREEWSIVTEMEQSMNRFDEPVQYARYRLVGRKEQSE